MPDRFVLNFAKTFAGARLVAIEPKMTRSDKNNPKSPMVQATDKDNVPKWTLTVAMAIESFEKTKHETIPVTITSPKMPDEAMLGKLVTIEDLELGIMVQARSNGSTSFSMFYSATAIEVVRPLQPVKAAASGQ